MSEFSHKLVCPKCGKETATHHPWQGWGANRITCSNPACSRLVYDDDAGVDERADKTKFACEKCGIPKMKG